MNECLDFQNIAHYDEKIKEYIEEGILIKKDSTYQTTKGVVIGGDFSGKATGMCAVTIGGNKNDINFSYGELIASGDYSIATGFGCQASGGYSHAEGYKTKAIGTASHSEGYSSNAKGDNSHAEGTSNTDYDAAYAHAEGENTNANGMGSHSEGQYTLASGRASHAEGFYSVASGPYSHAAGYYTVAYRTHQTVIGGANIIDEGGNQEYDITRSAFIIGNGARETSRSNCFRVTFDGNVYGLSAFNSSGADYAEYFEWEDGNPDNEDRIGKFVSLTQNGKIAIANSWNDVIGVISGMSSIVGNAQEDQYHDMYVRDIYGRFVYEDVEVERETGEFELNEDGSYKLDENEQPIPVMETVTEHRIKINPNYDATKQYVPRSQRKEWDAVGLLGQVVVEDDGTCVVGMRCTVADGGIATSGDKYRVIKRLDDNHIVVLANFLN